MSKLKRTPRPKIVREKRQAQPKRTQGRVKAYVVRELLEDAVDIVQKSGMPLGGDEFYVLLKDRYRKLTPELMQKVVELMVEDPRVKIDYKSGTVTALKHDDTKEGIVSCFAHNTPFVIDNETGEKCQIVDTDMGLVLPGDAVRYSIRRNWDGETAQIKEVLEHHMTEIVGEIRCVTKRNGRMIRTFRKYDARLSYLSVTLEHTDEEIDAMQGKPVVLRITHYPQKGDLTLKAVLDQHLDAKNDADLEIEQAVRLFDLPYRFSHETVAEAEALPEKVLAKDRQRRVDLRDVPFCTIDGEDAKDFDDAVFAARVSETEWRLLVAIADVSYYVKPGKPLDIDAQIRGTSVYFPRRVIPMLPEKLSNGLCSLNPNVDRCAMVCDMLIDHLGTVKGYQFYPAIIHSKARLTYTKVWSALSGEVEGIEAVGEMKPHIDELYALYKVLRAARQKRGAIDFATRETYVKTDENGQITAILPRETNDAHRLIEECMLAANTCAADFIESNKKPSLYRVHDSPAETRLEQLREVLTGFGLKLGGGSKPSPADYEAVVKAVQDKPYGEIVQMALLRSMQRAVYSPENIGHYGLSYECYTHFTSPIRRYPDLLVHRTIKGILSRRTYKPTIYPQAANILQSFAGKSLERSLKTTATDGKPAAPSDWVDLGKMTSACERRADEASRDVTSWLKCRYLQSIAKPRQKFTGRITAITGFGLYVELDEVFVEGFVHISRIGYDYYELGRDGQMHGQSFGETFKIGQTVKVRLHEVDEDKRRIDFSMV